MQNIYSVKNISPVKSVFNQPSKAHINKFKYFTIPLEAIYKDFLLFNKVEATINTDFVL